MNLIFLSPLPWLLDPPIALKKKKRNKRGKDQIHSHFALFSLQLRLSLPSLLSTQRWPNHHQTCSAVAAPPSRSSDEGQPPPERAHHRPPPSFLPFGTFSSIFGPFFCEVVFAVKSFNFADVYAYLWCLKTPIAMVYWFVSSPSILRPDKKFRVHLKMRFCQIFYISCIQWFEWD